MRVWVCVGVHVRVCLRVSSGILFSLASLRGIFRSIILFINELLVPTTSKEIAYFEL